MIERTLRLVSDHQSDILAGLWMTLELMVIGEALALAMGLVGGLARLSRFMAVRAVATCFSLPVHENWTDREAADVAEALRKVERAYLR